jgi:hypothetical protein
MNAMLEFRGYTGAHKFESLLELRWTLENKDIMAKAIVPLVMSSWRLMHIDHDIFPLSDPAISMKPGSAMVALSPRHLLEIDPTVQDVGCRHRNWIDSEKLAEFRRRTIGNTFREIIFGDRDVLEDWRKDPAFQERVIHPQFEKLQRTG